MADPFEHEVLSKLAYQFWQERGSPFDSPDVDWQHAEQQLYARLRSAGASPRVDEKEMLDSTNDN